MLSERDIQKMKFRYIAPSWPENPNKEERKTARIIRDLIDTIEAQAERIKELEVKGD